MMNLNKKIDAFDVVFTIVKAVLLCGIAFIDPWLIIPCLIAAELIVQLTKNKKEELVPYPYNAEEVVQDPQGGKRVIKTKDPKKSTKTTSKNSQDKSPKSKTRRNSQN